MIMGANDRRLSDEEFQVAVRHLDTLVRQFEILPIPEVQEKVFEMLQAVDALHREGLSRLVALLRASGQEACLERAAEDEAIRTLLLFYDLLQGDPFLQAEKALDAIRPYIHSHGGEVELLDVQDGSVHLRLSGACHGCSGSTITLQRGIEQALREGLPGFQGIQVHPPETEIGRTQAGGLITFDELQTSPAEESSRRLKAPVFKTVARLDALPPGAMLPVALDGKRGLLANVDGEVYAIGADCPGTDFPLTFGKLEGARLTCSWHGEVFDVRSGKCLFAAGREDSRSPSPAMRSASP
jgi:Fe-S cluster biogenesis protein NfuA/nitrite reductase/ring-hydroxylating ferredoxin subunit